MKSKSTAHSGKRSGVCPARSRRAWRGPPQWRSGLRGLLYGVAPHDPPTLAAVVVLVASASLAAAWVPARRAARVEPWELLRDE
ncbi:MAG TPA: hypothetical protein VGG06_03735 [Thermoanaerobaculia bacterium]|jgi:hypothetical protein